MNNYIKRFFFLCAIPQKSVTLQQNYMAVKLGEALRNFIHPRNPNVYQGGS